MLNKLIPENYLTNIPQDIEKYGFSKVLYVRYEMIHIKHIFTELFVRKTIDYDTIFNYLHIDLSDYIIYMTNKIRRIYNIRREYSCNLNDLVKKRKRDFFPLIELYSGLNNVIILDFDGVVTKNSFKELYFLCRERCNKLFICSANPQVEFNWFVKRDYPLPDRIFSMKGKRQKIKQILEINKKYDNVFYVDDEEVYLDFTSIFGVKTFRYRKNKIKHYSSIKSK